MLMSIFGVSSFGLMCIVIVNNKIFNTQNCHISLCVCMCVRFNQKHGESLLIRQLNAILS